MICFAWSGFPQYAARCVGAFVSTTNERVVVIATKPKVPIEGMDKYCKCELKWIGFNEDVNVLDILGEMPRVLIVTGWGVSSLNRIRDQARECNCKIIGMSDNNYRFSLFEIIKAIRFRLFIRSKYDAFIVPGNSACKLLIFYGMPKERIHIGMYAADGSIFKPGKQLSQRPKKILFVGQLCKRKNVLGLARAFLSISEEIRRDWILEICGCGPDESLVPRDPAILLHAFVQPEELAVIYNESRCFVLPSHEEHWGVVVHEAVLSGCMLILSDRIGAALDFAGFKNALTFKHNSTDGLKKALEKVMLLSNETMDIAFESSITVSRRASINRFVCAITEAMKQ